MLIIQKGRKIKEQIEESIRKFNYKCKIGIKVMEEYELIEKNSP
jgi:hypothetical protein